MRVVAPYRQLNKLIQQESIEPKFSWGIRMAIAGMAPFLYGLYTGNIAAGSWVSFVAECICWIELKGNFRQRVGVLAAGALLSLFFGVLGSVSSTSVFWSILLMLTVGFVSGLFKNLGDRGGGMAITVYALFIFCNAYPVATNEAIQERTFLILLGGAWSVFVGILASLYIPVQEPYRRSVALIWRSISEFTITIGRGWEGTGIRSNEHDIYLKEKQIREAMDNSLTYFEKLSTEADKKDGHEYSLAQVRRMSSIVAMNIFAMTEEMSTINTKKMDPSARLKVFTILRALQQSLERMAIYTTTLKSEEQIILSSRIYRVSKLANILKEYPVDLASKEGQFIQRFAHLAERIARLMESSMNELKEVVGDKSTLRAYPLVKTFFILHPKYWWSGIRQLFNFNRATTKYSLRTGIAAAFAMFIYKAFNIHFGYWLPFTLMIVAQPYITATIKKGIDRVIGTVVGGIAGSIFLLFPTGLFIKEFLLFISFLGTTYFLGKKYSIAVFFITLNLVLLFNIDNTITDDTILMRAIATTGGAVLAVLAGFLFLPDSDKKMLPRHLATSISGNYAYFIATFFPTPDDQNWIRYRRVAETGNSNAFDSFNRYMQEPSFRKKPYAIFFYVITHNIRLTRELNSIQLENDGTKDDTAQKDQIYECLDWFNKNVALSKQIDKTHKQKIYSKDDLGTPTTNLSEAQLLYLEKLLIELKAMHYDMEILAQKVNRIIQL